MGQWIRCLVKVLKARMNPAGFLHYAQGHHLTRPSTDTLGDLHIPVTLPPPSHNGYLSPCSPQTSYLLSPSFPALFSVRENSKAFPRGCPLLPARLQSHPSSPTPAGALAVLRLGWSLDSGLLFPLQLPLPTSPLRQAFPCLRRECWLDPTPSTRHNLHSQASERTTCALAVSSNPLPPLPSTSLT